VIIHVDMDIVASDARRSQPAFGRDAAAVAKADATVAALLAVKVAPRCLVSCG
jgi:hypothetical protein